jgi:ADP-ribose pyrophosphatase YjhB (NUDIX family)
MKRPEWLRWTDNLWSIARAGLTYSRDPFDRERFSRVEAIAAEILASRSRLEGEDAAELLATEDGYLTPKVDVRAAVFERDRILLVREVSDGRWSLPGGWADVGESAGEVAVREVREEAGLEVRATRLVALLDKSKHDHPVQLWYVYKAFFACEVTGGTLRPSAETPAVDFFARDALPPLSIDRITPGQIERMFRHHADPTLPADFD